jgi:HK97 family phage portal protein
MALKDYLPFLKKKALNETSKNSLVNKYNFSFYRWFANGLMAQSDDVKQQVELGYRKNIDVFSIINFATTRASSIQWKVYELKERGKKSEYENAVKSGNVVDALKLKAKYWEESNNKALNKLITTPNNTQTWGAFVQEAIGYKLLTGNRYIYQLRPVGSKKASQLFILPSHFMTVKLNGESNYLDRHNVFYVMDTDFNLTFNSDEVYHSKTWNPAILYQDFLYGFSPIQAAMNLIEKSNDSYSASAFAFKNMGVAGILSQGGSVGEDGGFMTPDEAKQIQNKFEGMGSGASKFKKIFTTSASVSWTNLGMSPVDLNIIESQKMDLKQIANLYRVPVQLLNDTSSSTFDNMQQAERSFYLNSAIPELTDLRDVLNNWIVPNYNEGGKEYYIDFEIKNIPALQTDLHKLSERLIVEMKEGLWTRNEVRKMLGEEIFTKQPEVMDRIIIPNTYLPRTTQSEKKNNNEKRN